MLLQKIHSQAPFRMHVKEDGTVLGMIPRKNHFAIEGDCGKCGVKAGSPCKDGDSFMTMLDVHLERVSALV